MRIVFMGTPDFAVPSLHKLIQSGYEIAGVVTQPDRPKGRKRILTPPPVKEVALQYNLPVHQPEKIRRPEEYRQVLDWQPDLIVTAAFGQILPKAILEYPRYGCINVHASLLPKYRGGAPIHRAVMNGEKETGVTIMYMVEELDAGDIISQVTVPIEERDTAGSVFDKLKVAGAELLVRTLPELIEGSIAPVAQDPEKATYAPNITREDEKLDFTRPARTLYNQIRGLNPWPVAYALLEGQPFKVWWADWDPSPASLEPGTIEEIAEDGVTVSTGEGKLILREVQPAGKTRMTVAEFLRGSGRHLKKGMTFDRFED